MKTSHHHYFSKLPDPRIHGNKKHLLIDIMVLSIIAVICGADSWNSIELFGNSKKEFLSTILKLPNGIPSHDTIDAMGTQKKIAKTIIEKQADYIFA